MTEWVACAEQTHKLVNSKELLISQKPTTQAFSEPVQQTTKRGKWSLGALFCLAFLFARVNTHKLVHQLQESGTTK